MIDHGRAADGLPTALRKPDTAVPSPIQIGGFNRFAYEGRKWVAETSVLVCISPSMKINDKIIVSVAAVMPNDDFIVHHTDNS